MTVVEIATNKSETVAAASPSFVPFFPEVDDVMVALCFNRFRARMAANQSGASLEERLSDAIRFVLEQLRQSLVDSVSTAPVTSQQPEFYLTPRQYEILEKLAEGLAYKQIAHQLGLSTSTVRTNLTAIYSLTGVHDRGRVTAMFLLGKFGRREYKGEKGAG